MESISIIKQEYKLRKILILEIALEYNWQKTKDQRLTVDPRLSEPRLSEPSIVRIVF